MSFMDVEQRWNSVDQVLMPRRISTMAGYISDEEIDSAIDEARQLHGFFKNFDVAASFFTGWHYFSHAHQVRCSAKPV